MDILSVCFLVLHLLIIGLSVFIGYRRALGRSLVRLVYLIVIGFISFFGGRILAKVLSETAMGMIHGMLPADIQKTVLLSPELEPLLANMMGALLVPVLFAVLFGILELLTLICFKRISGKIVTGITKIDTPTTVTRITGAATGLVLGIAIATVLLSPVYVFLNVAENTSTKADTILSDAYDSFGMSSAPVMKAQPTTVLFHIKPSIPTTSFFPWEKPFANLLTSYSIHQHTEKGHRESLLHSLPVLLETSSDALYAYNVTIQNGGLPNDALTNAAATIIPHLEESDTVKYLSADAIHALGVTFQNGDTILGFHLPESDDPLTNSLLTNLVNALADTSPESAKDNMITLFGMPTISYQNAEASNVSSNSGLLSTMTRMEGEDPLASLAGEDTLGLVGSLAENNNMTGMMDDIQQYTQDKIKESDLDLSDRQYETFYNNVKDDITTQITNHTQKGDATITDVAKDIATTLDGYLEENEIEMDDMQVSVVSVSLAKEFMSEDYLVNGELDISVEDLMSFFGIDESQIPDWAK